MNESKKRILKKIGSSAKTVAIGILDGLLATVEDLIESSLDKRKAYQIAYGYVEHEWSMEKLFGFFSSARRKGYIQIVSQNDGQKSIIFTDKLRIVLLESISDRIESDGKYRYVSFDIPEQKRRQRNGFRRAIKKIGFKQVQKSLWVIDKNVGDLVEIAAHKYEVEKYVAYIIGERSDIDDSIGKILYHKVNEQ